MIAQAADVHEPAAASAAENVFDRTNTGNKRKADRQSRQCQGENHSNQQTDELSKNQCVVIVQRATSGSRPNSPRVQANIPKTRLKLERLL